MYQHTKRDIHIFSEPRNQLEVTQRDAYFPSSRSPRKAPPNYHHLPERGKSRIGVYPQQAEAVNPLPDPVILDTHLASADATTKPSDEAHTHFELPTAPSSPKDHFRRFNDTNTNDSPVWKHLQNSRREFEEFEWHLRCVTLLFFSLLAAIFRLWQFAAWYIFSCASQAFLLRILIPRLFTFWSAMVSIFRNSAPVRVVSIVDFALESNEVFVELARCASNRYGQGFVGSKNAHTSIP